MPNYTPKFAHLRPRQKLFPDDAARVSIRVSTEDREFLISCAPASEWTNKATAGAALRQFVDVVSGKTDAARLHCSGTTREAKHPDARSHIIGMVLTVPQRAHLSRLGDGDLCAGAREVVARVRMLMDGRS